MTTNQKYNTYFSITDSKNKIISKLPKYLDNEELIEAGLGKDFYIAGGFVHDVMNNLTPKDIDIFIIKEDGFINLFTYFKKINNNIKDDIETHKDIIEYDIFKSIIDIKGLDITIQLINHCKTENIFDITENFDYDYLKCYYNGNYVCASNECIKTWENKIITKIYNNQNIDYLKKERILKSIQKGYKFDEKIKILNNNQISFTNKTFFEIKEILEKYNTFYDSKELIDYKLATTKIEYVLLLLFNTYVKNNPFITSEY